MFDKLVVSSQQRRKHRTAKFFLATSSLYLFAVVCAFAISVLVSDPKLADTESIIMLPRLPIRATPPPGDEMTRPAPGPARQDLRSVQPLDYVLNHPNSGRTQIPQTSIAGFGESTSVGPSDGGGSTIGVIGGTDAGSNLPPPPPTPTPPQPRVQTAPGESRPVRITSQVLQGKAIERRTPPYPEIPKRMHVQDAVSVEVIISPEGVVESARAVSGHPLLRRAAEDAARGWRFQPTLLNQVPVRVTGVITFVFKLND